MSYVLSKQLNRTQLIRESFAPELNYRNHLRDIVARDVSHLPEEYYDAENVARELRQLDRDNRNLMPVSNYFLILKKIVPC